MTRPVPILDAAQLAALFERAFPGSAQNLVIEEIAPGRVHMIGRYNAGMLRPGGVISGPSLVSLADTAAYAIVLAHVGERLMAVTSNLNIHFLKGAAPGDIHAEAELLRLGARSAVCDVRLWTEAPDVLAAHATVAYSLPPA
ncbi:MAG TPA: PaaI family thioesterase [Phenylobacterium sp.]